MLTMGDTSVSFNAESLDATTHEHVASLNASYSNNVIYFGLNLDKVDANIADVKTDLSNFIDRVMAAIPNTVPNNNAE